MKPACSAKIELRHMTEKAASRMSDDGARPPKEFTRDPGKVNTCFFTQISRGSGRSLSAVAGRNNGPALAKYTAQLLNHNQLMRAPVG